MEMERKRRKRGSGEKMRRKVLLFPLRDMHGEMATKIPHFPLFTQPHTNLLFKKVGPFTQEFSSNKVLAHLKYMESISYT